MIEVHILNQFAIESNEIERIYTGDRHETHLAALEWFMELELIHIEDLKKFVFWIEIGTTYRAESKVDRFIQGRLVMDWKKVHQRLLKVIQDGNAGLYHPNKNHRTYEHIHPFSDGNGRSGRALWLWEMHRFLDYDGRYGFLQMYYYETLRMDH